MAKISVYLAWALLAVDLLLISAQLLLSWWIIRAPAVDLYLAGLVSIPAFVAFVAVGVLIVSRHPGHRFGWLLCLTGLIWQAFALIESYTSHSFGVHGGNQFGSHVAVWISGWGYFPALVLVVAIIPLLFPSGRLPRSRWRLVFWAALVGMLSTTLGFMLEPITIEITGVASDQWIMNPYGVDHWIVKVFFLIGLPLSILSGVAAGASIIWRLRHTEGIEQLQLKWIAYAGALVAAIFGVNTILFIAEFKIADAVWIVQVVSFASFPIAAGIAIVRYRLFDIDVLINRTLVYGLVTGVLGLTYLGLVLFLQLLLRPLAPQTDVAIALSTLGVAALVQPVRHGIQRAVDRRFYRRKYDAARTVAAFTAVARHEVDLDRLNTTLLATVAQTMRPASISLWVRPTVSRRHVHRD